jgi:Tfp pilus assembly protein PilF
MGSALSATGKPHETIEQSAKASCKQPKMAEAFDNLGIANWREGDFAKTIENYRQACALIHPFRRSASTSAHRWLRLESLMMR